MNQEINKRVFWRYINLKINRTIHHYHVFAVISILFEEMINDLVSGKDIKIFNFGKLSLKESKPKKYFDVRFSQVMSSKGGKLLKFSLSKKFRDKLINYINLDETKKGD